MQTCPAPLKDSKKVSMDEAQCAGRSGEEVDEVKEVMGQMGGRSAMAFSHCKDYDFTPSHTVTPWRVCLE